jgi:Domain of unknown function (DUF397).
MHMPENRFASQTRTTVRRWHTSSYTHEEAACVEVSEGPVTGVRDSKNRDLGALFFPAGEWAAFVRAVRQGGL